MARTTSLPSSSSPISDTAPNQQEAEGRAFVSEPVTGPTTGVVVSLSHTAETVSATDIFAEDTAEVAGVSAQATETDSEKSLREAIKQKKTREQDRLTQLAEDLSSKLNDNLRLRFATDEETGTDLFQLIERETGEVVQQIPSKEVLEFMQKFRNFSGLLFSEQA